MNLILLNFFLITVFLLTSCNSSNSIRLKGSSDSKKDDFSNVEIVKKIEGASIVHIDQKQRIVTIRSNKVLNKGYYITISSLSEKESSVLKLYDASYESLFIADILELSLIHISEPTRPFHISYDVFCLKKVKKKKS